MERDWVQEALKNLRPNTPNWYGWAKTDSSGNTIPNDQRMCWEHAIVVQDGVTKPTQAEFDSKKDELEIIQNRIFAYPSIGDQLDMLFHAIDGDETLKTQFADFHTALKAVKDNNPKG